MSFTVDTGDGEYEYDKDTECYILFEPIHAAPFQMHYEAECSECGGDINVMAGPDECPNCGRSIVDWREK